MQLDCVSLYLLYLVQMITSGLEIIYRYNHMQLDCVSLYLLYLVQMITSGLEIIYRYKYEIFPRLQM
jgi:Glycosyl hydrolases family 15